MGIEPMVSALPMRCFTAKLRQPDTGGRAGRLRPGLQPPQIRFLRRTSLLRTVRRPAGGRPCRLHATRSPRIAPSAKFLCEQASPSSTADDCDCAPRFAVAVAIRGPRCAANSRLDRLLDNAACTLFASPPPCVERLNDHEAATTVWAVEANVSIVNAVRDFDRHPTQRHLAATAARQRPRAIADPPVIAAKRPQRCLPTRSSPLPRNDSTSSSFRVAASCAHHGCRRVPSIRREPPASPCSSTRWIDHSLSIWRNSWQMSHRACLRTRS